MAQRQRRIGPQFWVILIFVALVAYALIADWWEEHAVLGRVIVGIVLAVLALLLWLIPAFREWLVRIVKQAFGGLVYRNGNEEEPSQGSKPIPSPNKPIPPPDLTPDERALFTDKVGNRCENPTCRRTGELDVHHIKPRHKGGTNSVWNLLALCRNCHGEADKSIPPRPRQFQWASRHKSARRDLVSSGKWKYR